MTYKMFLIIFWSLLCVFGLILSISFYYLYDIDTKMDTLRLHLIHDETRTEEILTELNLTSNEFYSLDLEDFDLAIKKTFKYDLVNSDCKYYSYIWAMYFIKNNYEIKYSSSKYHIFVTGFKEFEYVIADQNKIAIVKLN